MILASWIAACALLPAVREETNRRWLVELELVGPFDEALLDCGADGTTRLAGPFLPGEERTLMLPVPLSAPLGSATFASLPLPSVRVLPAGSGGSARILRFASEQPGETLADAVQGLLAAPRPPVPSAGARPGSSALLVLVAVHLLGLAVRRRPLVLCAVLAGGAGLCFALGSRSAGRPAPVRVLDADVELSAALRVLGAAGEIALPRERLEVLPAGRALEVSIAADGLSGTVRAAGASLYALELAGRPELGRSVNGWTALSAVWTRSAAGEWTFHGPWPAGAPLPAGRSAGPPPPGWLATGLPPGRACLLARAEESGADESGADESGEWLRLRGGPSPDGARGPRGD